MVRIYKVEVKILFCFHNQWETLLAQCVSLVLRNMTASFRVGCQTNVLCEVCRRWSVEAAVCQNVETECYPSGTRSQWSSRRSGVMRSTPNAWRRIQVEQRRWEWTAACTTTDGRCLPVLSSSSRPCWRLTHGWATAGRAGGRHRRTPDVDWKNTRAPLSSTDWPAAGWTSSRTTLHQCRPTLFVS